MPPAPGPRPARPGSGLATLGEKALRDRITDQVPDLEHPSVHARYAGKRTAVIGSGASAQDVGGCCRPRPSRSNLSTPRSSRR
jgi:hypothetical protein